MTKASVENLSLFQVTEVELVYRNKVKPCDRLQIVRSSDVYNLLLSVWDMNKIELVEEFKIMLLDRRNACLGVAAIASGGITGCLVDSRIVFSTALKARASSIILAHNHPSGNLLPSKDDMNLTQKLVDGGRLLDIKVIEHLIVTPQGYHSLADEGMMPW